MGSSGPASLLFLGCTWGKTIFDKFRCTYTWSHPLPPGKHHRLSHKGHRHSIWGYEPAKVARDFCGSKPKHSVFQELEPLIDLQLSWAGEVSWAVANMWLFSTLTIISLSYLTNQDIKHKLSSHNQ